MQSDNKLFFFILKNPTTTKRNLRACELIKQSIGVSLLTLERGISQLIDFTKENQKSLWNLFFLKKVNNFLTWFFSRNSPKH